MDSLFPVYCEREIDVSRHQSSHLILGEGEGGGELLFVIIVVIVAFAVVVLCNYL